MVLLVVDTQKLITTLDLYNFNAFEDAVKTLIAAARENNVEVVYVRKHGNMRKENNHAVIPVRKNLFTGDYECNGNLGGQGNGSKLCVSCIRIYGRNDSVVGQR